MTKLGWGAAACFVLARGLAALAGLALPWAAVAAAAGDGLAGYLASAALGRRGAALGWYLGLAALLGLAGLAACLATAVLAGRGCAVSTLAAGLAGAWTGLALAGYPEGQAL